MAIAGIGHARDLTARYLGNGDPPTVGNKNKYFRSISRHWRQGSQEARDPGTMRDLKTAPLATPKHTGPEITSFGPEFVRVLRIDSP